MRYKLSQFCALQIEEVNRDVSTSSQEIEESNNKVTELRRQLQALEIDYDAQCSLVSQTAGAAESLDTQTSMGRKGEELAMASNTTSTSSEYS